VSTRLHDSPPVLRDYEIIERLHEGGQGVVYRAFHRATRRLAAIKVLRGGNRAREAQRLRFAREVEVASRLNHPHIVTIYDSGVLHGSYFFAMEFVEGLPIDEYVFLHELSVEHTLELMIKVCRAAHHAHMSGVIHRDLKPSNILIDASGEPHVLDFGLARDVMDEEFKHPAHAPSISGQIVGTLPYLSPEQAAGESRNADIRADVYALGVILFQVLSRQFPYSVVGHPDDVRANIIRKPPTPLRAALRSEFGTSRTFSATLTEDLEAVLFRALEKDPAMRYQSAAALADDLGRCRDGKPVEAKSNQRFYLLRKTLRAYRTHAILAGVFVLILLGAVVGVTVAWRRSERVAEIAKAGLEMGSLFRSATVARDDRRLEQAIALFEKAAEIGAKADTNDQTIVRLAITSNIELGRFWIQCGDVQRAKEYLSKAVGWEHLLERDDVVTLRQRSSIRFLQGEVQTTIGAWPEALRVFEEARALAEAQVERAPESETVELERCIALGWVAMCKRKLKMYPEALRDYCDSFDGLATLTRQWPDRGEFLIEFARAHEKLAAWHMVQKSDMDNRAAIRLLRDEYSLLIAAGRDGTLDALYRDAKQLFDNLRANMAKLHVDFPLSKQ